MALPFYMRPCPRLLEILAEMPALGQFGGGFVFRPVRRDNPHVLSLHEVDERVSVLLCWVAAPYTPGELELSNSATFFIFGGALRA